MHFNNAFIALALALAAFSSAAPAPSNEASTLQRRFTIETGNATLAFTTSAPETCSSTGRRPSSIVALSPQFNVPALCGQYVSITNTGTGQGNNGKRNGLLATVYGTCASCAEGDLGLDEVAFSALLQNRVIGNPNPPTEFGIEWHFCDANGDC